MQRVHKVLDQLSAKSSAVSATDVTGTCPMMAKPAKVLVTGAAGNIAYAILFGICRGKLLGPDTPIDLILLDIPPMAGKMEGVVMELKDCAFPLIRSLTATTDYATAFTGVEYALLIGARPRGKGMVRADLLKANAKIFEGQGKALDKYASRNVKVVVVGNPANTNALIAMHNAPSLPRKNFTALTRLDQNRAVSQLADRLKLNSGCISNVVIWGNHSKTQYPDVRVASVMYSHDCTVPLKEAIADDDYLKGEFISTVQQRGAAIIQARGLSSAASAANACLDHIRDWANGTQPGQMVSMAVLSDGSYGVPKGIIYSFPVTCAGGEYKIVQGIPIDQFSKEKMQATAEELLAERKTALGF